MNDPIKSEPPLSDHDKIVESVESINKFSESLGPSDIYKEILMEELLKIFMKH